MAAHAHHPHPPAPKPEPALPTAPAVADDSASGGPATPADRIAFQVWIIFFLLAVSFGLLNYLVGFFGR